MQNPLNIAFNMFMQQMRGRDPQAMLDQLISSGRIDQRKLDLAQKNVEALKSKLDPMKNNFGFQAICQERTA